jgi:hypothetical protein
MAANKNMEVEIMCAKDHRFLCVYFCINSSERMYMDHVHPMVPLIVIQKMPNIHPIGVSGGRYPESYMVFAPDMRIPIPANTENKLKILKR